MMNLRLLAFILSLCTVSVAAVAATPACPQLFAGGRPPALVNPKLAQRATMLCNDAYASLASGVTHGALWSAEHPTADSLEDARATPRQGEFHVDDRLPPADAARLDDYRDSGYDRGHMTPSGDMPDSSAQEQSFSLANMVPQTSELNRGVWEGIESAVRRLAARRGELYVVTGPAFVGRQISSIGADGVLVPTSTWKAIYDPTVQGSAVYVCANTAAPKCQVVPVATLTARVGIDPFPAVPERTKRVAIALPKPEPSRYAASENGIGASAPGYSTVCSTARRHDMAKLIPFADDAASVSIGKLTVENGTDRVALYGSLDLTRDKQGLAHARALKTLIDGAVQLLEGEKDLPDAVPAPAPGRTVSNPFS